MFNGDHVVTEYEARKADAVDRAECIYGGCNEPPAEDSLMCKLHGDAARARTRRAMAKAYRQRAKKKLCRRCGRRPQLKGRVLCAVCRVRRGQWGSAGRPKQSVLTPELNADGQRIAERTSIDADGRVRYHGKGSRGRQPLIASDAEDLREAQRALSHGEAGLKFYWSAEVQALPKAQRAEVRAEALAKLASCQRWIDEVLVRNGAKQAAPDPADE